MKAIIEMMEAGRFDLAHVEIQRASVRSPADPKLAFLAGRCLEEQGRWTEARELYADLWSRAAGDVPVTAGLARTLAETGEPAAALELLADVEPVPSDKPLVAAARARALGALGDHAAARRALVDVAAHHPEDPELVRAGWRLAVLTGDDEALSAAWSAAVEDPVAVGELVMLLCERCHASGRPEQALALLGRADPLRVPVGAARAVARLLNLHLSRCQEADAAMRDLVASMDSLDRMSWTRIVKALIDLGRFREARSLSATLAASDSLQNRRAMARLAPVLATLPDEASLAAGGELDFEHGGPLRVPKPDGVATVVVFARKAWQARLIHQALEGRPVHVLHLRERVTLAALVGTGPDEPALDYQGALDMIRGWVNERGGPLVTIGQSAAGYPALRYGLDLGAQAILALSPPTSLDRKMREVDTRVAAGIGELVRVAPEMAADLRPLIEQADRPPRIMIHYGADSPLDTLHAEHLAGLPTVRLVPRASESRHSFLVRMQADGTLAVALDELLSGTPAAAQATA